PVKADLIKALIDWEFTQVYSDGSIGTGIIKDTFSSSIIDNIAQKDSSVRTVLGKTVSAESESIDLSDFGISQSSPVKEELKKQILTENPIKKADISTIDNEQKRMSVVQSVYNEYLNFINMLYTRYATHKELDLENISSKIKDLCIFIKDNRRYVLRVEPDLTANNRNFLISHSMRSTVLAITVGLQLRMPLSKLIELGTACILHEIGMLRLPSQLYLSDKVLSTAEKNQLNTHPIISYTILKGFNAPLSVCLGVLEHHEKENGNGYPRRIAGSQISIYAKIISIVCSFEAITAPRSYKTASSSFEAMVELLKNSNNQYDGTVMKALLYSLSLFPIGSYVYLSDERIARVIDVNPENPKNPIVQIIGEKDENDDPVTVETNDTDLRVLRPLNKTEVEDLVKVTGIV
ncbi:MAG: HD-GYP domain-containing protein, partial [Spirochaetaceae bacterium]|nr:HD-GYP domain-containing protein [Spirochaetaceae bacterium]